MDKFDLTKFMIENRMTKNSKVIAESDFSDVPGSGTGGNYYDRFWKDTVSGPDAIKAKKRDAFLMKAAELVKLAHELEPEADLKELVELIYEFT